MIYTSITASSPFIETDLQLSPAQMSMFIKGLIYITPCQSRFLRQSIDMIVAEQYTTLHSTIQGCLDDHGVIARSPHERDAFPSLKRMLHRLQSKQLSYKQRNRARRERAILKSIMELLHSRPDVVVRRTDKTKALYVGNAETFARKAIQYMVDTAAYEEIPNNACPLTDNLRLVTTLLNSLLRRGAINQYQHKIMFPDMVTMELGHLHFMPKPHKPGTPLRPIGAAIHAPSTAMSAFLNDLLAPVFLRISQVTTFINSTGVIRALEKYVSESRLQSTTLFVIYDVANLYTMIPRQGALDALRRFLEKHLKHHRIGTLSVNYLMDMAQLVLNTNCFAYEGKYYRQIRGGAMGSAFTQTLANIYMLEWEQDLVQHQLSNNEIYGRYIDDGFMTTNLTREEIDTKMKEADRKDPNIRITYTIASAVAFLDVTISNGDGRLTTSVFHKPAAEPYVLPYTSDHPRHVHRNIPYAALLRAARICSNVHDFDLERVRIDMALLLNEYPPAFISEHFHRFFELNNAMPVLKQLDPQVYHELHQKLLHLPTRREKELQGMPIEIDQIPDGLRRRQPWNSNVMYARYIFESGPRLEFPREFRKWWHEYFVQTQSNAALVQVKFAIQSNRTLEQFLVHKKPPREMLRKRETDTARIDDPRRR